MLDNKIKKRSIKKIYQSKFNQKWQIKVPEITHVSLKIWTKIL
jgi:hypothetical protein